MLSLSREQSETEETVQTAAHPNLPKAIAGWQSKNDPSSSTSFFSIRYNYTIVSSKNNGEEDFFNFIFPPGWNRLRKTEKQGNGRAGSSFP